MIRFKEFIALREKHGKDMPITELIEISKQSRTASIEPVTHVVTEAQPVTHESIKALRVNKASAVDQSLFHKMTLKQLKQDLTESLLRRAFPEA